MLKKVFIVINCFLLISQMSTFVDENDIDAEDVKSTLNRIRQEEIMAKQGKTAGKKAVVDRQIKVMSYNVLAQDLVDLHSHLYRNHSPENLVWEYRSQLLMEQITSFMPDILTLQEVQESHIGPFYKQLEKYGYRGIFKRRTGNKTDGCAVYYMSSLLDLVEYKTVEYYRPHMNSQLLNRPNVALIARLRSKSSTLQRLLGRDLIVANTHLLYSPWRNDVRMAQIQILLAEIHKIISRTRDSKSSKEPAVIVTGDLNSLPDSPVIRLLEDGRVSSSLFNSLQIRGLSKKCIYENNNNNNNNECKKSEESNLVNGETCDANNSHNFYKETESSQLDISHSLNLSSVYDWRNENNHNLATTFQGSWVIVDYMFYSNNMQLISRLKLPTAVECEHEIGWIPNKASPSDHFPLAATFIVE